MLVLPLGGDVDRACLARVTDGVAQQVRQRAHQQLGLGQHAQVTGDIQPDLRGGSALSADRLVNDVADDDQMELDGGGPQGGPGKGEQFVHEAGHVLDVVSHVVDVSLLFLVRALFEDAQRHLDPGQRRTEFVGNVAEKALLAGDEPGQPRGHAVDGLAERAEFVAPAFVGAGVESSFGDLVRNLRHLREGMRDAPHQRSPEQRRKQHRPQRCRQPRFEVEKQSPGAQGPRERHQHERAGARRFWVLDGGARDEPVKRRMRSPHHEFGQRAARLDDRPRREFRLRPLAPGWRGQPWTVRQGRTSGGFLRRQRCLKHGSLRRRTNSRGNAAFAESEPDFGREGMRFSGHLAAVSTEDQEFNPIGGIEALQDCIPFGARLIVQLARDHIADRLDTLARAGRQQPIESVMKLRPDQQQRCAAQQSQIQEKPEQNLGVQGKAQFHDFTARQD